jgi:glycosyltransferase involved in cell wall biosynthesis
VSNRVGPIDVESNVRVFRLSGGKNRVKKVISFYKTVKKVLSDNRIDCCFVHSFQHAAILFFPFKVLKKIPVFMWYCHSSVPVSLVVAHFLVDKVITAAQGSYNIPSGKVVYTGHGIDIRRFSPIDAPVTSNVVILSPSRGDRVKNVSVIREAVARIGSSLYGKQVDYAEASDVPYPKMPEYYQYSDIMLNASDTGSVDKNVLEAMSCGCVPITSNPGFLPVFGALSKFLFVTEKTPEAFCAAIKMVAGMSVAELDELKLFLRTTVMVYHNLDYLAFRLRSMFDEYSISR